MHSIDLNWNNSGDHDELYPPILVLQRRSPCIVYSYTGAPAVITMHCIILNWYSSGDHHALYPPILVPQR
ncbi:hypothetical protein DPMN_079325 [Dreissena polymorpha]|uniref:Uncharacterized protein n=1 Tax=Dreissena polymorpha TaxID=45954 RepID=A0A9D4BPY8_DREPO|nr:hypothetical protein DPMN_079325 [Dreissena polymorpha]